MADNILKDIFADSKEGKDLKKKVESIDKTITDIYDFQKSRAKEEDKQRKEDRKQEENNRKKLEQQAKRKKGDKSLAGLLGMNKSDTKKAGKGFFADLFSGGIGSIAKLIGGALVIKTAIVGLIGGAILLYAKSPEFRNAINSMAKTAFEAIRKYIIDPSINYLKKRLMDSLPDWVKPWFAPKNKSNNAANPIAPLVGGEAKTKKGTISYNALNELYNKQKEFMYQNGVTGESADEQLKKYTDALKAMRERKSLNDQLYDTKRTLKETEERIENTEDEVLKEQLKKNKETLSKKAKDLQTNKDIKTKQVDQLIDALKLSDDQFERKQRGGPINVPGQGSGDKVPFMLPAGSFVMNRNAVGMFQNGGMVPTLLEPGEQVYAPGQWGEQEMMMNSLFSRFQSGGEVAADTSGDKVPFMLPAGSFGMNRNAVGMFQNGGMVPTLLEPQEMMMNPLFSRFQSGGEVKAASHPNTGSGFQPKNEKDYKGRPVVMSEGAAKSFIELMKASAGVVKGSDITSSQRSRGYNSQVGGAQNSHHLYGNAMDIHGDSKAWLKQNASKHGWQLLPAQYTSHDGHFDYKGGGAGNTPSDGVKEGKEKLGGAGTGGFAMLGMGGTNNALLSLIPSIGSFVGGLMEGLGLGNLFGGQEEGPNGSAGGSGDAAKSSAADTSLTPNRRAMLDTIAYAEGTSQYPSDGYKTMFTGKQFAAPPWEHPRQIQRGGGHASDAAGRYQFLSTTWDGHGLSDFSPKNQDKAALQEVSWKGGLSDVDAGRWSSAFTKSRKVWASLPGAGYGQPEKSMESLVAFASGKASSYNKAQTGGVISMSGTSSPSMGRFKQNQAEFAKTIAEASGGPQVVVVPVPSGGGGGPTVVPSGTPQQLPPSLPEGPSSIQAAEYFYRLNLGSVM